MNLQHLRHFVAVAQELNFGRAAERIGIAQPPLSQSIQRLEVSLGCSLFRRTRRQVELTAAGEALLQYAPDILDRLEYAKVAVTRAAQCNVTQITIAFTPNALISAVPIAIRAIKEIAPNIDITLLEGDSEEQLQKLLQGAIDLAFFHPVALTIKGLEIREVECEPLMAAVPKDSPLACKDRLSLRDLAGQDLILFHRRHRPDVHTMILAAFRSEGVEPRIAQEAAFDDTRIKLVAAGMGISLVGGRHRFEQHSRVAFVPLDGLPVQTRTPLYCGWRRQAPPLLKTFFEAAFSAVRADTEAVLETPVAQEAQHGEVEVT